ncbi:MAG: DUF192 domain-containing protein [Granulosicoccus sp.]|nr:DUF192 domain-containing protein [Granulosicoccus sp.]
MNDPAASVSRPPLVKVASYRPFTGAMSPLWRLTSVLVALVATLCLLFAPGAPADVAGKAQPRLPTLDLLIDGKPLTVELAVTGQQRYMGLSFRTSMPEDSGMLFVYEAERPLTFTMRNTLIPLSIAFISSDLVINEIHLMNVGPNQLFDSEREARYALEVNQGWFTRNGIGPGAQIVMR